MEIEGHPTVDLIVELEQRGALRLPGTASGPDPTTLPSADPSEGQPGLWLFLPPEAFQTGMDDLPG